eukprot:Skav223801  [mRNA]  locus=scaffold575:627008:627581:- [translate_table: standard]
MNLYNLLKSCQISSHMGMQDFLDLLHQMGESMNLQPLMIKEMHFFRCEIQLQGSLVASAWQLMWIGCCLCGRSWMSGLGPRAGLKNPQRGWWGEKTSALGFLRSAKLIY